MGAIARDAASATQLVYVWPSPLAGGVEVNCAEDEVVVMCPAWTVGDSLGPGKHSYHPNDPAKPLGAYFVLTQPVEAPFDVVTSFVIPATQQFVRLRASGSLLVRCNDPATLVAQFVGLSFRDINEGLIRSVSQSAARMVARVLVRRAVMMASPMAIVDPAMMGPMLDEIAAANPLGGAVFGLEFVRMQQLEIHADDGGQGWAAQVSSADWRERVAARAQQISQQLGSQPGIIPTFQDETVVPRTKTPPIMQIGARAISSGEKGEASGEISLPKEEHTSPGLGRTAPPRARTGEIAVAPTQHKTPLIGSGTSEAAKAQVAAARSRVTAELSALTPRPPATPTPPPGSVEQPGDIKPRATTPPPPDAKPTAMKPGSQVLVAAADGRLQSAVIRRHHSGFYELDVSGTGETVWVAEKDVIPEV